MCIRNTGVPKRAGPEAAITVTANAPRTLPFLFRRAPSFVIGIAFTHAMTAFRWVRDHYTWIRVASGAVLVALGLLLFFHRDWWLQVAMHRALEAIGLDQL